MLRIETKGSWREMGRQVGEAFRPHFDTCMEHWCPWFIREPERYAPAIREVETLLRQHAPELIEETEGMAEGAGIDRNIMMGYRLYPSLVSHLKSDCSVVFLAGAKDGPLVGRNCDINRHFGEAYQLLQVCRPDDGPARIGATFLGLIGLGGAGFNEHGLGAGGASAHTPESFGDAGLPGSILTYLMLKSCRTVSDAQQMMSRQNFLGKGMNLVVADAEGASVLFEFAPGMPPPQTPRRPDRNWQACTNFYFSPEIPNRPKQDYLENAYARYGRIVHRLDENPMEHSIENLKQLMIEVAQPGLCCPDGDDRLRTVFSQVMDLKARKMHFTPGHPAEHPWEVIEL